MKLTPILSIEDAVALVPDGATVLIGGFGLTGNPVNLIHALCETDASELTVVTNNLGEAGMSTGRLVERGKVAAAIGSYFTSNRAAVQRWLDGVFDVTLLPQGSLVEAIRAGGYGIGGFYTPTGVGTDITAGHETKVIDGIEQVFVKGIRGDVALLRARRADRAGNVSYRRTDRNYNPVMATAASTVIVEVEEIVEIGELPPDEVHTPAVYVDYIVEAPITTEHLGSSGRVKERGTIAAERMKIAERVLAELRPGDVVNLGIGIPTLIADIFDPEKSGIVLHTENGMLGVGPTPDAGSALTHPVNAAKQPVSELSGASYFNSADSFGLVRGGHLDVAVLGGLQVSAAGDLANWAVPGKPVLGVGGAMDLASGARRLVVAMRHTGRDGASKVVHELSLPATVFGRVDTLVTELGVFRFPDGRITLTEVLFGASIGQIRASTDADFRVSIQ